MSDEEVKLGYECCRVYLCDECPYQKFDDIRYPTKCSHKLIIDLDRYLSWRGNV